MQRVWREWYLPARAAAQRMQGVWRDKHLPAWAAAQSVQGVWRWQHLPARSAAQSVQRVRRWQHLSAPAGGAVNARSVEEAVSVTTVGGSSVCHYGPILWWTEHSSLDELILVFKQLCKYCSHLGFPSGTLKHLFLRKSSIRTRYRKKYCKTSFMFVLIKLPQRCTCWPQIHCGVGMENTVDVETLWYAFGWYQPDW